MAKAAKLKYESLFNRSVAALIDNVLWFVAFFWVIGSFPESTYEDHPEVIGITFLVFASLWFNYFAICEWRWGQTVGKNAMGMRVLMADGSKPGFGPISIRNVLRIVDFFAVGPLMISSTAQHQRLGDKLGGTVVVDERTPIKRAAPEKNEELPKTVAGEGVAGYITWSLRETGWWVLGGLMLAFFITPLLVIPFAGFPEEGKDWPIAAGLVAQGLLDLSLIGTAIYVARRPPPFELSAVLRRLGFRPFRPSALGVMLLVYLVYFVAVVIFSAVFIQPEQKDIAQDLGLDEGTIAAIAVVFLIVVVAPFCEEAFFRGFLFAGLRQKMSLWPAALISGALFGAIHATSGLTTVVPLAMFGVALAWLYNRTDSLWPCVILHLLNNGIALAATS